VIYGFKETEYIGARPII